MFVMWDMETVVWTTNDLMIERIAPDQEFYKQMAEPIEHFFTYSVLPEIIGKWLTRRPNANENGEVKIPEPIIEDFTKRAWRLIGAIVVYLAMKTW